MLRFFGFINSQLGFCKGQKRLTPAPADPSTGSRQARPTSSGQAAAPPLGNRRDLSECAIIEKELSSATHVAETADGGLMPPRLVASPAAVDLPPVGG